MKPVTKPGEELDKPQGEVLAKRFRFAKNQAPWETEVLKSGFVVEWRRPFRNGLPESFGFFETTDTTLASELRDYAKANPARRIFEQE